ncbi:MAG: peptidase [Leifsonia flava]
MIDWSAFLLVAVASLLVTSIVVSAYSFGLRLLAASGRAPLVEPASFTDAITVITPEESKAAAKRQKKAAKKNPLSDGQKRLALWAAYACFAVAGAAVLYGIYLIIPYFHH